MIIATIKLRVLPESRKEFFQTINPLTERIQKEKGCLNYRLYEETRDENSLVLIGEWEGESGWNEHREGNSYAVLVGLLRTLSVASKIDFKLLMQVDDNK